MGFTSFNPSYGLRASRRNTEVERALERPVPSNLFDHKNETRRCADSGEPELHGLGHGAPRNKKSGVLEGTETAAGFFSMEKIGALKSNSCD